jgi:glycosyltransferase involved in cell wall biosynthesis
MSEPFFSVIIPTYNRANFLYKAIESVLSQTYKGFELIIIDDGSTDNTKEIISKYQDERIIYFYQENKERSAARNQGIALSSGKYICFLDSDDYYLNNRLELLYKEIEKLNFPIVFFYTGILYFSEGTFTKKEEVNKGEENPLEFFVRAIIGVPQVCISISILNKYKFNTELIVGEDMELWFRIAHEYNYIFLEEQNTVVAVEHNTRTVTKSNYNRFIHLKKTLKVCFSKEHPAYHISRKYKNYMWSYLNFGLAKLYITQNLRLKATYTLIISLVYNFKNINTKEKILIITYLLNPYINTDFIIKKFKL